MVDVFISYAQRERALMMPIKQRLETLGLILFVDVDGRLDDEATFPEALDKGVRASKAVLGCWSPWALSRPWVQTECAMAKDENKLVAVERVALSADNVPALFYLVDRKPLSDFDGTSPHEGWAMTLSALATKLKLWLEKRPDHPETTAVREKISALEKASTTERAAVGPGGPPPKENLTEVGQTRDVSNRSDFRLEAPRIEPNGIGQFRIVFSFRNHGEESRELVMMVKGLVADNWQPLLSSTEVIRDHIHRAEPSYWSFDCSIPSDHPPVYFALAFQSVSTTGAIHKQLTLLKWPGSKGGKAESDLVRLREPEREAFICQLANETINGNSFEDFLRTDPI